MINSIDYNKIYRDFDLDFKKNEVSKDLKMRTGIAAVNQSVKNIVLTSLGERPFNNEIGVGLYQYLFTLDDPVSLNILKSKIYSYLTGLETRIDCSPNSIQIQSQGNFVQINITYKLKSSLESGTANALQNLTITITGER